MEEECEIEDKPPIPDTYLNKKFAVRKPIQKGDRVIPLFLPQYPCEREDDEIQSVEISSFDKNEKQNAVRGFIERSGEFAGEFFAHAPKPKK